MTKIIKKSNINASGGLVTKSTPSEAPKIKAFDYEEQPIKYQYQLEVKDLQLMLEYSLNHFNTILDPFS